MPISPQETPSRFQPNPAVTYQMIVRIYPETFYLVLWFVPETFRKFRQDQLWYSQAVYFANELLEIAEKIVGSNQSLLNRELDHGFFPQVYTVWLVLEAFSDCRHASFMSLFLFSCSEGPNLHCLDLQEGDEGIEASVDQMQRVIELARQIRERKTKPLKQPLKHLTIVHPDQKVLDALSGYLSEYIYQETNIRELDTCNDPEKFGVLKAEPVFSVSFSYCDPITIQERELRDSRELEFWCWYDLWNIVLISLYGSFERGEWGLR